MNKRHLFTFGCTALLFTALATGLTACGNDDSEPTPNPPVISDTPKPYGYIQVKASLNDNRLEERWIEPDGNLTRMTVDEYSSPYFVVPESATGYRDNLTDRTLKFSEGDCLYLWGMVNDTIIMSGKLGMSFCDEDSTLATFEGALTVWQDDGRWFQPTKDFEIQNPDNLIKEFQGEPKAWIIQEGSPEDKYDPDFRKDLEYYPNYCFAPDINSLLRTGIDLMATYDTESQCFNFSPKGFFLDCEIDGLEPNTEYYPAIAQADDLEALRENMPETVWSSNIPYMTDDQGVMRIAANIDGASDYRQFFLIGSEPIDEFNVFDLTSYYCQVSLGEIYSGPVYFIYRHAEPW